MTSFHNKLLSLEARLKAENESKQRDRFPKDLSTGFSMSPQHTPRPRLKTLPIGGDCGSPGRPSSSSRSRRNFFPPPPQTQNFKSDNGTSETDWKLQEIMKQANILTIDGNKYYADMKDLVQLGELGTGTCGHVVKMRHVPSDKVIAVKQMRRSGNKEENKRITMDLDVVLRCHDCPHIVQCYGYFITESDVWICMELMATCLDKLLKRLRAPIPEQILGKMAVATVKALHYLKEKHGVIHRDVKPSNILLDEKGTVKLCDFGISGRLVDSKAKTRSAGCAAYMAPERIDPPDPEKPDYDIRADVWSLGISLVELATGRFPYQDCKTDFEVLSKVLQEDPPRLPPNGGFSLDFCRFVQDCLTKDYRKRPKYKTLLEHPFIRRYEQANVDVAAWFAKVMKEPQMFGHRFRYK